MKFLYLDDVLATLFKFTKDQRNLTAFLFFTFNLYRSIMGVYNLADKDQSEAVS